MPQFFSRLVADSNSGETLQISDFWQDSELFSFCDVSPEDEYTLNALVLKVSRNPTNLIAHLRRIYFCYQQGLPDSLIAALLDFILVLQGKGRRISLRMIEGSRSRLDSQQFSELIVALDDYQAERGNRFSLFTRGVLNQKELVEYYRQNDETDDFLALANDFIEYSQLDQAMDVLESGIQQYPYRKDLQEELLQIYKSIGVYERFQNFYKTLAASEVSLMEAWSETANYFAGRVS